MDQWIPVFVLVVIVIANAIIGRGHRNDWIEIGRLKERIRQLREQANLPPEKEDK